MCELCLPRRQVLAGLVVAPFLGLLGVGSQAQALQVAPDLAIHPRSDWAGTNRPAQGAIAAEEVRFLLVHHTAGATDYAEADVPQLIRNIYDFHAGVEKGWPDVAYNFLIDRYGGVWEAREGSLAGAVRGDATGGNQGFSQLVCVMGTFTAQLPTSAALESLVATLAWLADRHGLDTTPGATTTFDSLGSNRHALGAAVATPVITGHRAMSQTSCPGDALFGYVSDGLMADVTAARSSESFRPTETTDVDTETEIETETTEIETETMSSGQPSPESSTITIEAASTTASVTSQPSSTDTVAGVPVIEDSTNQQGQQEDDSPLAATESASRRSSGDTISAWQGLGLAGAGVAAAAAGLLVVRRRQGEPNSAYGPLGED